MLSIAGSTVSPAMLFLNALLTIAIPYSHAVKASFGWAIIYQSNKKARITRKTRIFSY